MTQTLLQQAHLLSGDKVDVLIDAGTGLISEVTPCGSLTVGQGTQTIDMNGYLLSTGFVEPHAHLDKVFLADRVENPEGDLMGAIIGLDAIRSTLTFEDIVYRSTQAAISLSKNGVTAIRTHADTTLSGGLVPLLALLETKRRCAHFIDLQIAMLLEWPLTGAQGNSRKALAKDAVAAGADVVGGCPHLDENPAEAIDFLLELAQVNHRPLDLHCDENLRQSSHDLETLADMVISSRPKILVNASHCVSLSTRTDSDVARIAQKASEASISVTVLPQTNLFLQARESSTNKVRAIAPIDILRSFGVTVAAGGDNVQDPFNPVGRLDPLETASLLVMAAHQSTKESFEMVTKTASTIFYGQIREIIQGQQADLVAIPAVNARQAIAMGNSARIVFKNGMRIAEQTYLDCQL